MPTASLADIETPTARTAKLSDIDGPAPEQSFGAALKEYASKLNPLPLGNAILEETGAIAKHPVEEVGRLANSYSNSTAKMLDAAEDAYKRGDYIEAARHALHYAINGLPGTGEALEEAGNKFQDHDFAGGLADTSALATQIVLGEKAPAIMEGIEPAAQGVVAGVRAGGADVATGAAKIAGGTAAAKASAAIGMPGAVDLAVGYPLARSGVKQVVSGVRKGWQAGTAAARAARLGTTVEDLVTNAETAAAAAAAEKKTLDEVAKALGAKDFASTSPEQQEAIRKVAAAAPAPRTANLSDIEAPAVTPASEPGAPETPAVGGGGPVRPPWMPQPVAGPGIGAAAPTVTPKPTPLRPPWASATETPAPPAIAAEAPATPEAPPAPSGPPPPSSRVVIAPARGDFAETKLMTEDGMRRYMAEYDMSEEQARAALKDTGHVILGRGQLNRALHGIGAELGLDHDAISDISNTTFGVKSMTQLSQEQMLEQYQNFQGLQSAANPLMKKGSGGTVDTPNVEALAGAQPNREPGGGSAVSEPRPPAQGTVAGAPTTIRVAGTDRTYQAQYEVRELADLQASHNPYTFQRNPQYGYENDRDYGNPQNAAHVIEHAQKFEPDWMVTASPDSSHGGPVIDEDGNVLGGNSRTMSLQRVYQDHPESAAAYRKLLEDRAGFFGIPPKQIAGMKQPVLVRVLPDSELSRAGASAQGAVTDFNVKGTADLTPAERATSDARGLTPGAVSYLGEQLEAAGPDSTLAEALGGKRGTEIINRLIDEGIFNEGERNQLLDQKTGAVTAAAKDRVSKMLVGQFFRDTEQFERTPPSIRNKLERVVAPLMQLEGKAGWDLMPEARKALNQAVDILEYAKAHGLSKLSDVVAQQGMFSEGYTAKEVTLAESLLKDQPAALAAKVRQYAADSRAGSMFQEVKPEQAFKEAFGEGPNLEEQLRQSIRKKGGGPKTIGDLMRRIDPGDAAGVESGAPMPIEPHPPERALSIEEGRNAHPSASEILQLLQDNAETADDTEHLGLRLQSATEARGTKPGAQLRPSSEWVDGNKTRNKLPGTAAFKLPRKTVEAMTEADIQPVLDAMKSWNYVATKPGERIGLIGSNTGLWDSDMPESGSSAFKDAQLIDTFKRKVALKDNRP